MTQGSAFATWAVVELMGHQQIAGHVTEEEIAGSKLLRVDVPELERGEVVQPAHTKYFGASAIYALHPCTEALARQAAASIERHRSPLPVGVPDLQKVQETIRRGEEASRWLRDREGQLRGHLSSVASRVIEEEVASLTGGPGLDEDEPDYQVEA